MAMITIGSYVCPDPVEYNFDLSDIDSENSGYSANGFRTRERIRHGVVKIAVNWTMLTEIEANGILDAVSPDNFQVVWKYANSTRTSTMICPSQQVSAKCNPTTNDYRWEISLNLEEV